MNYRYPHEYTYVSVAPPIVSMSVQGRAYDTFKMLFDHISALVLGVCFAWLFVAVAVAIKLNSKGPVLYVQNRSGRNGRIFRLYKFRTMHTHLCDLGEKQATHNDVRITSVGRFLRRSSLDELPQLWNIMKGDMSFVGPRPHSVPMDHDYAAHIPNYWLRYAEKPGLTGWAQVNDLRGETKTTDQMAHRITYDLEYRQRKSFAFDLYILMRTLPVIVH